MNSPNYMDQNLPENLNEFNLELQQKIIYEKLTTYRSLFDLNCVWLRDYRGTKSDIEPISEQGKYHLNAHKNWLKDLI